MREAGRKRKLDPNRADPSKTIRSRDDIRSILPESFVSDLQNDLYNPVQSSSNAHEIQRTTAKRPRSG